MVRWLERLERCSRPFLILAGLGVLVVIGIIDYLTGFEMLFSVFYLLEVGLAAWFLGKGFGLVMSVLSVLVWIGGDLAAGARYANPFIPVWNALILMVFYFIVVWLLTSLRALHRDLEARVRQRTEAPTREMAERQRLEEEILRVSERELEVFELLGQGRTTRQISETLRVSLKTVQAYCARIKEKLNLASATELLREAVRWHEETHKG